jgi:hypothetical protein
MAESDDFRSDSGIGNPEPLKTDGKRYTVGLHIT